jgi:hypothetical protein
MVFIVSAEENGTLGWIFRKALVPCSLPSMAVDYNNTYQRHVCGAGEKETDPMGVSARIERLGSRLNP